jgi:hypothetical protein
VQSHLLKNDKHDNASRARALYDARVRRRQLGLAERRIKRESQSQSPKAKAKAKAGRKEGDGVAKVRRERMGRREAAEKGVWRLRSDEAR